MEYDMSYGGYEPPDYEYSDCTDCGTSHLTTQFVAANGGGRCNKCYDKRRPKASRPAGGVEKLLAEKDAEIARLKEKYEPKPVVTHGYVKLAGRHRVHPDITTDPKWGNLKLTFTDGVLTGAEVLK